MTDDFLEAEHMIQAAHKTTFSSSELWTLYNTLRLTFKKHGFFKRIITILLAGSPQTVVSLFLSHIILQHILKMPVMMTKEGLFQIKNTFKSKNQRFEPYAQRFSALIRLHIQRRINSGLNPGRTLTTSKNIFF